MGRAGGAGAPRVRQAAASDVADLLAMTRELAAYERSAGAVEATEESFRTALFGPDPRAFALVAEVGDATAGMAVYFWNFSTWTGCHGIYLEDLFVRPAFRRLGVGRALLARLAAEASRRGFRRLEWAVLDWNGPAIDFYRSLGAEAQEEWTTFRLDGGSLSALARGALPATGRTTSENG